MEQCIFCKIVKKDLPATVVYEDNQFLVFKDIHPKSECHLLIIPKTHIPDLRDLRVEDSELAGQLLLLAAKIAQDQGLERGFRIVINNGPGGGQEVPHLHLHLMGGNRLSKF